MIYGTLVYLALSQYFNSHIHRHNWAARCGAESPSAAEVEQESSGKKRGELPQAPRRLPRRSRRHSCGSPLHGVHQDGVKQSPAST